MHSGELVAFLGLFGLTAYVLRTIMETFRRNRTQRLQFEMFNKLLDKGTGSKEMIEYLQSDAGQKLLESAPASAAASHGRVLTTLQAGLVAVALGVGCLGLRSTYPADVREPTVYGILLMALGLGLLAASGASLWLSRSLGLLDSQKPSN